METGNEERKGKFRVVVEEHSAGGLFELEVTTRYYVVDNRNENILMKFESGYSAEYDGVGWANGVSGGVKEILISEDEKFVIVHEYGKEEPVRIALPE